MTKGEYGFLGVGSGEAVDLFMRVCFAPVCEKIKATMATHVMYVHRLYPGRITGMFEAGAEEENEVFLEKTKPIIVRSSLHIRDSSWCYHQMEGVRTTFVSGRR